MRVHAIVRQSILLTLFFLSACTTGIPEFEIYDTAYRSQSAEADRVLDRLAAAERLVAQRQFKTEEEKSGQIRAFDPDEALYYLKAGDPPLTGAIRASLAAVTRYNAALVGLADGSAAESLTTRIGAGASSLTTAAEAVATVTGAGAAAAPTLRAAIGVALPAFQQLATIANRADFKRQLIAAHPDTRALLLALQAGTPAMFEVIKRSYVERGGLGGGRVEGIPANDLPRLEGDRALVAGWVVLIDRTIVAMDRAVAAAAGGGAPGDVSSLVEAATEVRSFAEAIRAAQAAGQF